MAKLRNWIGNLKVAAKLKVYRVLCEMMNRRWNADNWIIYKNA
jgi:hypothetical protein